MRETQRKKEHFFCTLENSSRAHDIIYTHKQWINCMFVLPLLFLLWVVAVVFDIPDRQIALEFAKWCKNLTEWFLFQMSIFVMLRFRKILLNFFHPISNWLLRNWNEIDINIAMRSPAEKHAHRFIHSLKSHYCIGFYRCTSSYFSIRLFWFFTHTQAQTTYFFLSPRRFFLILPFPSVFSTIYPFFSVHL